MFAARRPAAEMVAVFEPDSTEVRDARRVSLREEDRSRRLAAATLVHDGSLANLCTVPGRAKVAAAHADLLVAHGVQHLDETDVTSRDRAFTQELAARLYDDGRAGVRYTSNIDRGQCIAIFEGRYVLDDDRDVVGARPSEVESTMRAALGPLGLSIEN